MALVQDDDGISTFMGTADIPRPSPGPSLGSTFGAAFRDGNDVMAVASLFNRKIYADEPGFNPLNDIRGTKYERNHLDTFLGVKSRQEMIDVMGRIDQEEADRETLASSGGWGIAAGLAAGLLSPTIFMPIGGAVRSVQGGWSWAKSAGAVGAGAGLQAGVSELALQAAQETRTWQESAVSIGSATLLGGFIGAGAAGLLSRSEFNALAAKLEADRPGVNIGDMMREGLDTSAGAAQADTRSGKLVGYYIDKIPVIGKWHAQLSPNTRVLGADNLAGRQTYLDLVEIGTRTEDNVAGLPTSHGGAPVSRLVKDTQVAMSMRTDEVLRDGFAEYRMIDGAVSGAKAQFDDMTGRTPADTLTRTQFNEEVTIALFSADAHPNAAVQKSAQTIRNEVLEPLRKALVDAGLLDDAIAPKGDPSWFLRQWDKQALVANRPDAMKRFGDWLERQQVEKRGTQDRLVPLSARLDEIDDRLAKLDAQEARLSARGERVAGARRERAGEQAAVGKEAQRASDRVEAAAALRADIEASIAEMKASTIPEIRARAEQAEQQLRDFTNLERRATASRETSSQVEREALDAAFPKGTMARDAIEMLMGRMKEPRKMSMIDVIVANGGIRDPRMRGEMKWLADLRRPGLLRKPKDTSPGMLAGAGRDTKGGRTFDDWGEFFAQDIQRVRGPEAGRPTEAEIIDMIMESSSGRNPAWFDEIYNATPKHEAARFARDLDEKFTRGENITTGRILDLIERPMTGDDIGRVAGDSGISPAILRQDAGDTLDRVRKELRDARARLAASERGPLSTAVKREAAAGGADRAVWRAAARGEARVAALADAERSNAAKAAMLKEIREALAQEEAAILARIEGELSQWAGKTTREAMSAIKARMKVETDRDPTLPRLRSADGEIRKAMDTIIGSDRDLSRAELEARADEIISRIIGTPDGRLPYDAPSGGVRIGAVGPRGDMGEMRGSLRGRDFAIPTADVLDFIVKDPRQLMASITRTLVPDLELVRRFGDVDMVAKLKEVQEDGAKRANLAATEKERTAIQRETDGVIRDIAAQRDRIRNIYGWSPEAASQNMARFAAVASRLINLISLGGSMLNSMGDMAGIVFMYGFERTFNAGWKPYLAGLTGQSEGGKIVRQNAKAALIAVDTQNALRSNALADIFENHVPGSKFERSMHWLSDRFQVLNLQAQWTDIVKTVASTVAADGLLALSEKVSKGSATAKDMAKLLEANVDAAMAARIWGAFEAGGGQVHGSARLPNTADWADKGARAAFERALRREADIAVITPGLEKPLFMSKPVGSLLLQFKSFVAGANERLLIANLQRSDINTLQGLFASVAFGMLSYKLYSIATGQATSERPQDWIKEGISRSGVLAWFDDINSVSAKMTRGQADMYRLIGADKPLSRMQGRGQFSSVLGPTVGMAEKAWGIGNSLATGDWTAGDTRAARRMLPFQNLFYLRRLIDEAEAGINERLGVPPLPAR